MTTCGSAPTLIELLTFSAHLHFGEDELFFVGNIPDFGLVGQMR
jgi:hypothetical protein